MKLWQKMLIGLGAGVVAGLFLGPHAKYIKPIGSIFLSLLNMLVIPLVFSSLTVGVTSIKDIKQLGRVGFKTLFFYVATTVVAIIIGLGFSYLINPGTGVNLVQEHKSVTSVQTTDLLQMFTSLVPNNPINSLASGNILQVILFSILLGLGINFAGEKGKKIAAALDSLSHVMFAMTSMVMKFAPYGIFAIMAWVAGTFGMDILLPLLKFVVAIYIACIIHMIFVYGGIITLLTKLRPMPFFKGMRDAITVAASTTSSSASLPASMHCTEWNLGVSKNITSFVLPLGTTINMNGTAIFQAISAIFIAQVYGIELSIPSILTIIVTTTLAAIGCAGIPGGGLVTLSIVLSAVGLPLEGIAIVAGVDRIRDIICTVVNVLGDAVVAVYVAKGEGEFDEKRYYSKEIVAFQAEKINE